jgi:hypothetical protein
MNALPIRDLLCRLGVGVVLTAGVAAVPALISSPASADPERPACSKEEPGGNSGKKCPSPSPSETGPTGTEIGCRDLTHGEGRYRAPVGAVGSVLEFQLVVDFGNTPTCPEVTYTVIARDRDTLAELARDVQNGNGVTADLFAAFNLPSYSKDCIAVDVVISEGDVVHDLGPDSRGLEPGKTHDDLCRDGSGPQSWN